MCRMTGSPAECSLFAAEGAVPSRQAEAGHPRTPGRRPERARIEITDKTAGKAQLHELHKDAHLDEQDYADLAKMASSRNARAAAAAATAAIAAASEAAIGGKLSPKRALVTRKGSNRADAAFTHEVVSQSSFKIAVENMVPSVQAGATPAELSSGPLAGHACKSRQGSITTRETVRHEAGTSLGMASLSFLGSSTERFDRCSGVPRFSLLFPVTSSQLSLPSAIKRKHKSEQDDWRRLLSLPRNASQARTSCVTDNEDVGNKLGAENAVEKWATSLEPEVRSTTTALVSTPTKCTLRQRHRFANFLDPELDKTKKPAKGSSSDPELGGRQGTGASETTRHTPAPLPSAGAPCATRVGRQGGGYTDTVGQPPEPLGNGWRGAGGREVPTMTSDGSAAGSLEQPPLYVQSPRQRSVNLLQLSRMQAPSTFYRSLEDYSHDGAEHGSNSHTSVRPRDGSQTSQSTATSVVALKAQFPSGKRQKDAAKSPQVLGHRQPQGDSSLWTDDEVVPTSMEILEQKVERTKKLFAAELTLQSSRQHHPNKNL